MSAKKRAPKKDERKLTPVDLFRCQTEITTTLGPFRLGGPPKTTTRCTKEPTMVATEINPGEDGLCGSMSVCDSCFEVMQKQMTGVHYTRIELAMKPPTKPKALPKPRIQASR